MQPNKLNNKDEIKTEIKFKTKKNQKLFKKSQTNNFSTGVLDHISKTQCFLFSIFPPDKHGSPYHFFESIASAFTVVIQKYLSNKSPLNKSCRIFKIFLLTLRNLYSNTKSDIVY